jgi:hypothetical protein
MGYELVGTPKTEKVTQALAIKFRDMDPVPNDRKFNQRRLEAYRKMLAAGLFRPVQWATAFCNETAGTYRANGKHTSTLLAEYEESPQPMYAVIEHYHCDRLEDLAKLYATFDSRAQVRTTNDINRAFAAIDPDLAHLPSKFVNLCVTAVAYSSLGERYANTPAAERAEVLLDDYVKLFVEWSHEVLGSRNENTRHIWRASVLAAMYATFQKSRKASHEFWLAVRDGTGQTPKTPDRVLNKYLLSRTVELRGGGLRASKTAVASPREMYVKCLHAWNAWRRDTNTDLKYHAQGKIPAAV